MLFRAKAKRGFSLIEAVIAMGIMAAGFVAIFSMINRVQGANRSMGFQQQAIEAYNAIAAQIRDAQCDFDGNVPSPAPLVPATTDPGLAAVVGAGWIHASPPNSSIIHVGLTDGTNPNLPRTIPPMRVSYQVNLEAPPVPGPTSGPLPGAIGPAFDIQVLVREITGDPARDNPAVTAGFWIRNFPMKKTCNPRFGATRRGEYQ